MSSNQQPVDIDKVKVKPIEDKWLQIALDTTATDKNEVDKLITAFYKNKGIEKAPIFYFDNPVYALRAANFASKPEQGEAGGIDRLTDFINTEKYRTEKDVSIDFNQYGQLDAYWFIYWDYLFQFHPELVAEYKVETTILMDMAKQASYFWLFDKAAIVTTKLTRIVLDNQKFSNKFGPSVSWKGLDLYALEGDMLTKQDWLQKTVQYHSSLAKVIFDKI